MFSSVLDTRAPEHLTIRTRTHRNPERCDGVVVSDRRPRRVGRSARRGHNR
jgi:hypothetical protein